MSTPAQLEQAIASTLHEIAQLKIQNARLPSLRHELAAATSSHALRACDESYNRLKQVSDELTIAAKAQEQLAIKEAAVRLLEHELALAKSDERRLAVTGLTQNFDNLKQRYKADSEALLSLFRQMDHLHRQHLAATGQALLWERDYTLNLPEVNSPNDSAWHTTGAGVRA